MNALEEWLKHTVLRKKLTELQEKCRRVKAAVSSSMINVVCSTVVIVPAVDAGNTSFYDALRRTAELSELQIKYNRRSAQMSSATSECGNGNSLARERSDDIIDHQDSLDMSREEYQLLERQAAGIQNDKRPSLWSETHVTQKWVAFRRC